MGSLKTKTKKQLIKEIEKLREQIKNTDIKGNEGNIDGHISSGEDITKRNQTEDALAYEHYLFHTLMNHIPDAIYFKDKDSHFIRINKAQADMFGLDDPAEAVGMSDFDFFKNEHAQVVYMDEQEVIKSGKPLVCQEEKETWPDGHETWALTTKMPFLDKEGKIVGTFGISRDITGRKQAEEEIQIERDNLRNILESMDDGVYIVNQKYDIQYVNPVLKKEFGEVKGHKCYEYFHDRKDVCPWCQNKEVWKGKTVRWEWYSFKNQRTYDLIDTPLKNPDGSIYKLEIFRDITERRQTEEKLRESEKRLDLAIKGTGVGTWDWMVQDGEITYSERWAEIIGYTLEELSPINTDILKKFIHPDDLKKSNEPIEKHFAGETEIYNCELRMKHKNGSWIWMLDRGKVFEWDKDGKPIRVVGTHLDITAQKKIEEERERVIKMLEEKIDKKDLPEGFIPMCAGCHKIRDENKQWQLPSDYLSKHTNLVFTHGMCPDCMKEYYGEDILKKINYDKNK